MEGFAEYSKQGPRGIPLSSLGLLVRDARVGDVPKVAKIAGEREGKPVEHFIRLTAELLAQRSRGEPVDLKVAEFGGQVVGFGKSRFLSRPANAPPNCIPEGWYLTGLVVDPMFRRRRVGLELTRLRLEWLFERTPCVYYFASAQNRPTIALHDHFGFREISRDIWVPKVSFTGGIGILYKLRRTSFP